MMSDTEFIRRVIEIEAYQLKAAHAAIRLLVAEINSAIDCHENGRPEDAADVLYRVIESVTDGGSAKSDKTSTS